jgi:hypothetical protein
MFALLGGRVTFVKGGEMLRTSAALLVAASAADAFTGSTGCMPAS